MRELYISFLSAILVFLICSIIEDLVFGDRGKDNQISNYFKYIKGETKQSERKKDVLHGIKCEKVILKDKNIIYMIITCIIIFLCAYIVTNLLGLSFFLSLLGFSLPKMISNNRIEKRKNIINMQFRDALNSIVSSLKAGLSINSALIKCSQDLEKLYSLIKDKPMLDEFILIKNDLNMGLSVDEALIKFMKRMKLEDIDDFVNSVIIVRQKGGNLVEVVENVAKMINDKIEIRKEIGILVTSKKFEARIMTILPITTIIFLSFFARSYIEPLYQSFIGKVFIFIGFIFLVVNYFVANKIVNIEI